MKNIETRFDLIDLDVIGKDIQEVCPEAIPCCGCGNYTHEFQKGAIFYYYAVFEGAIFDHTVVENHDL